MTQTFSTIASNASEAVYPHLRRGLVGAWVPSIGVTGGTLRDVSGRGSHGTLTNMDAATDWEMTATGRAIRAAGGQEFIESDFAGLAAADVPFTLFFDCRVFAFKNLAVFGGVGVGGLPVPGGNVGRYWLNFSSNFYFWGGANDWNTGFAMVYNQDIRVAWRYDTVNMQLFVNGSLAATRTGYTPSVAASKLTLFSRHPSGSTVPDCTVRQFCVWDRALTANEIRRLDAATAGEWLKRKRRRVYSITAAPVVYGQRLPRHRTILGGGLR